MSRQKSSSAVVVSVIVPIYNVQKYLERCLESIRSQSYKHLEVLLINDGSTDDSEAICKKYALKDDRFKYYKKENGGLSDARNYGIKRATGDYFAFIDSDDWVHKDYIRILLNLCLKNNTEMSICGFLRTKNEEDLSYNEGLETCIEKNDYLKKYFKIGTQETCYYAWNKLYSKNIIDKEQYPKGLTSEDVIGTYRAIKKVDRIAVTTKVLYYYYQNPNSITGRKISKTIWDMKKVWDLVLEETDPKAEYFEWAQIAQKRVDYTILMQLALFVPPEEYEKEFKNDAEKALVRLKRNYLFLKKTPMPISRKITMALIVKDYEKFSSLLKRIKKI